MEGGWGQGKSAGVEGTRDGGDGAASPGRGRVTLTHIQAQRKRQLEKTDKRAPTATRATEHENTTATNDNKRVMRRNRHPFYSRMTHKEKSSDTGRGAGHGNANSSGSPLAASSNQASAGRIVQKPLRESAGGGGNGHTTPHHLLKPHRTSRHSPFEACSGRSPPGCT